MYGTLALTHRAVDDLADAAGAECIDGLRRLARPLEGLRILNLSLKGFGTGTAELLASSVPLLTDLGLDCHWQVVRTSEDAAHAHNAMYKALGGAAVMWTQEMTDAWLRTMEMNADLLTEPFDVVIVHDPQPAAIRSFVEGGGGAMWLFHPHLDLSAAQEDVWLQLRSHVVKYEAAIFETKSFRGPDLDLPVYIVPPAIDPNSARNMELPPELIRTILERHGVDPSRPLVCQVSPCDAESDLAGAVDTVCALRDRFPGLQLALILTTRPQDVSGRAAYDEVARCCIDKEDVFVLGMGGEFGSVELNAFQRAADVVMQRGLRRGFGLWVSDALWKERPVVVGEAPGLQQQVIDGETGLVATTPAQYEEAVARLLSDRELAARLGRNGQRHVADHFLITRYLRDYLEVLTDLRRAR